MGDGENVAEVQPAPCGRRMFFREIVAEMRAARFRAQRRKDGDGQRDKCRIGCRTVSLRQWQKIADRAPQPFRMSYDAEMAGNDGPDGGEVGCRDIGHGECCDIR